MPERVQRAGRRRQAAAPVVQEFREAAGLDLPQQPERQLFAAGITNGLHPAQRAHLDMAPREQVARVRREFDQR